MKSIVKRNAERYVTCKGCVHLEYVGPLQEEEAEYNRMASGLECHWYCNAYRYYLDQWVVAKANTTLYSVLIEKDYYKDDVLYQLGDTPEEEPKYFRERLYSPNPDDLNENIEDLGFIAGDLDELEEWMRAEPDTLEEQMERDKKLGVEIMDNVLNVVVHNINVEGMRKLCLEDGRWCDLRVE